MKFLPFFLLILIAGCKDSPQITAQQNIYTTKKTLTDSALIDTSYFDLRLRPTGKYENTKQVLLRKKNELATRYTKTTIDTIKSQLLDEARWLLTEELINTLIPFWYGTPWAFEGYTAVPQKGEVACGYFVSTTLKHSGFNLDRYQLAQQKPETEARSLQLSDKIQVLENISPLELRKVFASEKKDGLYFVGLSSHVGYLLQRKGELFFIHSNYIGTGGVTIEKAVLSDAFAAGSIYYIADLTHNDDLIKSWIGNTEIKIRK